MNRRDFMKTSMLAMGGAMLSRVAVSTEAFAASKGGVHMEYVTLNNGVKMPILGYGTLKLPEATCADCVSEAIKVGWRLIDTAKNYTNEEHVGQGIKKSASTARNCSSPPNCGSRTPGMSKQRRRFSSPLTASSSPISISTSSISPSATSTAHGEPWKNSTTPGKSAPSA